MTFFEILSTLLIGPLKLVFEIIFSFAYKLIGNHGLAIIGLSLVMNFLLLPLYKRTDAIQEASRDTEEKLRTGVDHIKKAFSGDERMMILQTYYRQNNYKPTDALNGSVSLLLEVPFFMAAYQFLSNLQIIRSVSFGPIADLSAPDALLVIGSLTINVLPVIMTVVNIVSSALYLKGFPLKTKIQLYAMALFFLVFLYNSPSALVMYWTMNNLFSLFKTLFYKLKNPARVVSIGASAAGLGILYYVFFLYNNQSTKVKILAVAMGVALQLPVLWMLLEKKLRPLLPKGEPKPDRKVFLLGGLFLAVLTGLLIPSTFIAASPQEFVDITYYHNPLWYCVSASCLAAGMFLVWFGVFYWLANDKAKAVMDKLVWILCGVMIVNYLFFGTNLGIISADLQYKTAMVFSRKEQLINIVAMLVVVPVLLLIIAKRSKAVISILLTASIALGSMSVINIVTIHGSMQDLAKSGTAANDTTPYFELSTTGNNVVVIMLDCSLGVYVPYLLQEKPELQQQLEGFTYYDNVVSLGGYTNFGTPGLFGGYEYTPVEMNKRDTLPLVEKHNEALKLMPAVFTEHDFKVTVCDPAYANYQWIPDFTIYSDYPEINKQITEGVFGNVEQKETVVQNNYRNFFCFSIMKSMPVLLQPAIYNAGMYHQVDSVVRQVQHGVSVAEGMDTVFMNAYAVLQNLPQMSQITDDDRNTFMVMVNNITHDPMLLQTPDYTPSRYVDNTDYDAAHADRFTLNGRTLKITNSKQMSHYHANMAAMMQLGNWFDYLRENGVYDNTRIILVSDHGAINEHYDELIMDDGTGSARDVEQYFPLLMVKDFGSTEFTISSDFMTNADVPTLAMEQLIENPVNPFTGKIINNDEKYAHDQMIILSDEWSTVINSGNTFLPSRWAAVKDNIWEKDNWSFSDEVTVLTEYVLP